MRVDENISVAGYFWLPDNESYKIPGTISVEDGGRIDLEIVGLFEEGFTGFNDDHEVGRIYGSVEKYGAVTLEGAFYKKKNISFGRLSRSYVRANMVLFGAHLDAENAVFNKFNFSIDGLDEWVGISGISLEHAQDFSSTKIGYSKPDPIHLELDDCVDLEIDFSASVPLSPKVSEARVSQKTYMRLSSDFGLNLKEFIARAYKINNLLCFALDQTVNLNEVVVLADSIFEPLGDGKTRPVRIQAYYSAIPFVEDATKVDIHSALFSYGQIRATAEENLKNWFAAYEVIEPSLALYFGAISGAHAYLDSRFLSLAQALETLHRRTSSETKMPVSDFRKMIAKMLCSCQKDSRRWLHGRVIHGNELPLRKRLVQVMEPFKGFFGSASNRKKLVNKIVDTRNYLTHYDERLESKAVMGADLWELCLRMEALFQLHLLEQLGFSNDQIEVILQNNYKLQQKVQKK